MVQDTNNEPNVLTTKDMIISEIRPYTKDSTSFETDDSVTLMIPYSNLCELEIVIWKYPLELSMLSNSETFSYVPGRLATIKNRSTQQTTTIEVKPGDIGRWIYSTIHGDYK
jgi:hypothetical protein